MTNNHTLVEDNNFEEQPSSLDNSEKNVSHNQEPVLAKMKRSLLMLTVVILVLILTPMVAYFLVRNQLSPIINQNNLFLPSTDQSVDSTYPDQPVADFTQVEIELNGFEEKLGNFVPEKSVGQFTWQNFTGEVTKDGKLIFEPVILSGIKYTMQTARNAGINSQSDIMAFLEDRYFYPSNANWDGMNLLGFQKDKTVCLFTSDEYGEESINSGNITEILSCGQLSEFIKIELDTAVELIDHLKLVFGKVDGEFKDLSGFSYYSLVDNQEKTISGVGFSIEGQSGVEIASYLQMNGYLDQSWGAFNGPFGSGVGCSNGKISCQVTQILSSVEDHSGAIMTGDQVDQTSVVCTDEVVQ